MHGPRWPPIARDGLIGARKATEPWNHARAMEGRRGPCIAHISFHCLNGEPIP